MTDLPLLDVEPEHRETLHRVCAHVLGRRRFEVSGRFGLRAGPGGIVTPAFGESPEVLRIAGTLLVREVGAQCTWTRIDGSTLRELATFAGATIDAPFVAGKDTPAIGDPDAPLTLTPGTVMALSAWFQTAWRVLDEIVGDLPAGSTATTTQLWPEHFDAATTVTLPTAEPANLGFSAGDGYEPQPYVYVGPWSDLRPGNAAFWNAPFGAVRRHTELGSGDDLHHAAASFLGAGLAIIAGHR